jgi:hypothetical protein
MESGMNQGFAEFRKQARRRTLGAAPKRLRSAASARLRAADSLTTVAVGLLSLFPGLRSISVLEIAQNLYELSCRMGH